jgi:hypothetical protein
MTAIWLPNLANNRSHGIGPNLETCSTPAGTALIALAILDP